MPSVLGNAGLPPQAAFVTLPSGRWKRKDAESAPTCRSRVFVRRATAKAGDRYKKRGLCRGVAAGYAAADRPTAFCRSCACPQHRARTLASRQARTCGVLYGLRRTKKNRRRLRTAVSSRTARRRARRAGRPERSPIWRLACMRLKRRRRGRGYFRHARSRPVFRKENGALPAVLLTK